MWELVTSTLQAGFGALSAQSQRSGRSLQRSIQKHGILRYGLSGAIALVLIIGVAFLTTRASYVNVLQNGDFEDGFHAESCGLVGNGWSCFTNGGAAGYGFYDDQWDLTVASGAHSQLIEVNAKGIPAPDADRFAGIYQTVRVLDWADYVLSLQGMIRTTVMDGDPWRYRVEVGWSDGKYPDWTRVTNWQDVGWTTFYERTSPGSFSNYSTKFTAMDDYVTIYVRIWKKWGVPEEEIDLNLDYIALTGPSVYGYGYAPAPAQPAPSQPYYEPNKPAYTHESPPVIDGSCQGGDYIYNGSFEYGFNPVAIGHVGKGWGSFTNGGAAGYGFYDEQWPPVVSDGQHGQLIEINAKGFDVADNDRYAGIYQKIKGLQPGATYELTVNGLLRGTDPTDDPYRYEVQWGYNADGNWDWQQVSNWAGMDVGQIYPRTEPGAMGTYRVRFTAPSHHMVLFIRGWKKWGVPGSEMDLNLDNISLRGCGGGYKPGKPGHDGGYPGDGGWGGCTYVVQPGDTLGAIAARHGVWVNDLAYANGIADINWIYVGQRLVIPGCNATQLPSYPPAVPVPPVYDPPADQRRIHVVQPGETLSQICALYGSSAQALINANGIVNPNLIYVGQELVIP